MPTAVRKPANGVPTASASVEPNHKSKWMSSKNYWPEKEGEEEIHCNTPPICFYYRLTRSGGGQVMCEYVSEEGNRLFARKSHSFALPRIALIFLNQNIKEG